MNENVIRTERGWAGHFICANSCRFRRNTLLEYKDKKWVVSTIGCMVTDSLQEIGLDRHYETMAFEARYDAPYWEANVEKEIDFESTWAIYGVDMYSDQKANEMHEKVVEELMQKIKD